MGAPRIPTDRVVTDSPTARDVEGLYVELQQLLGRFEVAVATMENEARLIGRPMWHARQDAAKERAAVVAQKLYLTPAELHVECGDSAQFIAARAAEGIIKCYGGPGNPKYDRDELYAAIRECRWHANGKAQARTGEELRVQKTKNQ